MLLMSQTFLKSLYNPYFPLYIFLLHWFTGMFPDKITRLNVDQRPCNDSLKVPDEMEREEQTLER